MRLQTDKWTDNKKSPSNIIPPLRILPPMFTSQTTTLPPNNPSKKLPAKVTQPARKQKKKKKTPTTRRRKIKIPAARTRHTARTAATELPAHGELSRGGTPPENIRGQNNKQPQPPPLPWPPLFFQNDALRISPRAYAADCTREQSEKREAPTERVAGGEKKKKNAHQQKTLCSGTHCVRLTRPRGIRVRVYVHTLRVAVLVSAFTTLSKPFVSIRARRCPIW